MKYIDIVFNLLFAITDLLLVVLMTYVIMFKL